MLKENYDGGLTCSVDVTDMEKAMEWYGKVLGFKKLYYLPDLGWCEMESPVAKVNVGLSRVDKMTESKGNAVLVWGVRDIEAAKYNLEQHGVKLDSDIREIPEMVRLLNFTDPFGNSLMFYQDIQNK